MENLQKRHWLRSYTDMPVWFAEKGARVYRKGQLRNKSPAGACFLSETRFSPQTELAMCLSPPEPETNPSTAPFLAIVKWQHVIPGRDAPRFQTGVQFVNRSYAGTP